jgi:hypothetical protein
MCPVCLFFLFPSFWVSRCTLHLAGMGLPFQRFQKNDEYAYCPLSDADDDDDSESEYTVASSSDGYGFERGRRPGCTARATRTPAGRRGVSTQSAYVESATQTTPPGYSRSPYIVPTYAPSTYSTSSFSPSLKASTSYQTLRSKTSRIFNTPAIRTDSAIALDTHHHAKPTNTRKPSAIEMQPLPPTPTHRYPPGVVVIKTMDDHGVEVIEETDLTHRGTPYIDLKPTVITREVHSGMVQKTARTGLMDRALERIVDALGRGEG